MELPTAVEEYTSCMHLQSWRIALVESAHSHVGAHMVHANLAVENTGWDHPQLWKCLHGACTHSCGGVYVVGAPVAVKNTEGGSTHGPRGLCGVHERTAVEEHTWCMHPWLWRSTWDVCTRTHI